MVGTEGYAAAESLTAILPTALHLSPQHSMDSQGWWGDTGGAHSAGHHDMAAVAEEQVDLMKSQQGWDRYVAAQLCGTKGSECQAKLVSALEAELAQPSTLHFTLLHCTASMHCNSTTLYRFIGLPSSFALHCMLHDSIAELTQPSRLTCVALPVARQHHL